jgi:predicted outer membrane protein
MKITMRMALLLTGLAMMVVATPAPAVGATAQPSAQDKAWLVAAHQVNLAEIAAGKLAEQKGTSPTVKALGKRFVEDHTKLDRSLRSVAQQANVTLPHAPSAAQLAAVQQLNATAKGADFDKLWIQQQLAGHASAIQATQQEVEKGSDAQVKQAAVKALPVIKAHHDALAKATPSPSVTGR